MCTTTTLTGNDTLNKRLQQYGLAALFCITTPVMAAGALSLPWQDSADSGMGFSSGITATETPASTWFNPAALAKLSQSGYLAGATLVGFTTEFNGNARREATDDSMITGRNGRSSNQGGNPGGINPPLPQIYYARPLGERFGLGFGIVTPYAIISAYEDNWVGRYHALESSIITTQFGPALGWRLTDQLWLGGGINVSLWGSTFSNDVDLGAILERRVQDGCRDQFPSPTDQASCLAVAPNGLGGRYDFYNELDAAGPGIGAVLAMRWQLFEPLSLGIVYRSPITHQLRGEARRVRFGDGPDGQEGWDGDELRNDPDLQALRLFLDGQAAINPNVENFEERVVQPALLGSANGDFKLRVVLPEQLIGGLRLALGEWIITSAVNWTRWERFNEFRFNFEDGRGAIVAFAEFKQSFRYSLGLQAPLSQNTTLRTGLAYETGAVDDATRSARAPDGDRVYITTGIGWRFSPEWMVDMAAGGFIAQGGPVNDETVASGSGNVLSGEFDDLVSFFGGLSLHYTPKSKHE